MSHGWRELKLPPPLVAMHMANRKAANGMPRPKALAKMENGRQVLQAILTRDPIPAPDGTLDPRWHLSVSGPGRVPEWNELAMACHEIRPGVPFIIAIPPRSHWMNVNEHVLHAYELRDATLLDQFRFEGRGDRVT